jgi:hypothetical protein
MLQIIRTRYGNLLLVGSNVVAVSVLVEHHILAQLRQLETHSAGLTVTGTLNRILGHSVLCPVLHPGDAVPLRVVDLHPRPRRENDHQVTR